MQRTVIYLLLISLIITTSACSFLKGGESDYPLSPEDARKIKRGKLTGDGVKLFGKKGTNNSNSENGVGVNSVLWRATLDTIAFMPLDSADPFGGVIITDWYEDKAAKGERFKLNVLILGTKLSANALKVSVFKQIKQQGKWVDETAATALATELEDKILTRARQIRIDQMSNS